VALSAVLGVAGGVVSSHVLKSTPGGPDPLGLGVSLVNQACTGESLLVTGWGTATPPLAAAVAEDPDHVRYLDITHSCATAWKTSGTLDAGYATYLGPYSTVSQACQTRMTAEHRGDLVTRLKAGTTQPVQCLCYLDYATMPTLRPGMEVTDLEGIYIRALQQLLVTLGLNQPDHLPGLYDAETVSQIRQFQGQGALPQSGVVSSSTWHALLNKGCKLLD
jgi:Putative peptidoglycan binding domain